MRHSLDGSCSRDPAKCPSLLWSGAWFQDSPAIAAEDYSHKPERTCWCLFGHCLLVVTRKRQNVPLLLHHLFLSLTAMKIKRCLSHHTWLPHQLMKELACKSLMCSQAGDAHLLFPESRQKNGSACSAGIRHRLRGGLTQHLAGRVIHCLELAAGILMGSQKKKAGSSEHPALLSRGGILSPCIPSENRL